MKSFKELMEETYLRENIQAYMKKKFKGNKEYEKMKNKAKKNPDNIPDFLDFIFNVLGDAGIEKISKKYKMDYDKIAKSFLK